jgi:hypothetical protein
MTYAGVILTVLIDFDVNRVEALYWGTLAMALLTILAWKLVKLGNIKR